MSFVAKVLCFGCAVWALGPDTPSRVHVYRDIVFRACLKEYVSKRANVSCFYFCNAHLSTILREDKLVKNDFNALLLRILGPFRKH